MKGSLIKVSPWYQIFTVFALALAGAFIFLFLGILLTPLFFSISTEQLIELFQNPEAIYGEIEILKLLQGFSTIGTFLVPGLVGAYLVSRYPAEYLKINTFPKKGWLITVLVIVVTLSGTVVSDGLFRLSYEIPFPDFLSDLKVFLDNAQESMGEQMSSFLEMNSLMDFIEIFIIMAVLPAICEETLFRGVVQPLFIKGFKNVHIGILVTSIIFGVMHQQFYSFLSITVLSIVLGYVREWSKSLWIPIILHLVNNGSIVVGVYFFNISMEEANDLSANWDIQSFIIGLVVFGGSLYLLKRLLLKFGTRSY